MFGKDLIGKSSREMGIAYVHFALAHPNLFRLMFGGQISLDDHPELDHAAESLHDSLRTAFRSDPVITDPETAAAAAWSLVHGLAHLLLDGQFRGTAGSTTGKFVQDVIGAVRFAAGAQRSA